VAVHVQCNSEGAVELTEPEAPCGWTPAWSGCLDRLLMRSSEPRCWEARQRLPQGQSWSLSRASDRLSLKTDVHVDVEGVLPSAGPRVILLYALIINCRNCPGHESTVKRARHGRLQRMMIDVVKHGSVPS